ncbi:hypothetical protein HHK36_016510 [Tetracentron sinense]|uniref:DEUBAD domain-containing protein n=1 Tax=Tetracentron sinense TaxID=13715 RepID=A0A834Z1H0_TETSI|nr:hypothetical protein HHK36_016510 [Tetracentron sinense]
MIARVFRDARKDRESTDWMIPALCIDSFSYSALRSELNSWISTEELLECRIWYSLLDSSLSCSSILLLFLMAILKNSRVSRVDGEFSPGIRDSVSSDEDELQRQSSVSESDDDDADSGAGSDDFDFSDLGETGADFCQVGKQNCSIPFELYDLPDLSEVLTLDSWNDCLTEEERFSLAEYLPDMDQETFMRTLKELFSCNNFQFGSPLLKLFDMLKGGLCQPRVAFYHQGSNFVQRRRHYNLLRKYQNSMVISLIQTRDAWWSCRGYSIEEKLQVLNIMRSRSSLMHENDEDLGLESDSSDREESGEGFCSKKLNNVKFGQKTGVCIVSPTLDVPSQGRPMTLEAEKYGKQNPKGILKISGSKAPSMKELTGRFPSIQHGFETKSRSYGSTLALPRQERVVRHDFRDVHRTRGQIRCESDAEEPTYEMALQRDRNAARGIAMDKVGLLKPGKKHGFLRSDDDFATDILMGLPLSAKNDLHSYVRNRNVNQMAGIDVLAEKTINDGSSYDYHSRVGGKQDKYLKKNQQSTVEDQTKTAKDRAQHLSLKGNQADRSAGTQPFRHNKTQEEAFSVIHPVTFDDWNVRSKKWMIGQEFQTDKNSVDPTPHNRSHRTFPPKRNDTSFHSGYGAKTSQEKMRVKSTQSGGLNIEELKDITMFVQSEETESDSSENIEEEEDMNPPRSKLGCPSGVLKGRRSTSLKSVLDPKKSKLVRKDKKEYAQAIDGITYSSKTVGDLGVRTEVDFYSSKGKQKAKMHDPSHLRKYTTGVLEESYFSGSAKLADDGRKQTYKSGKNGQLQGESGERLAFPFSKAYHAERKKKAKVDHDYSVPQSKYIHDYIGEEEDDLYETHELVDDHGVTSRLGKKGEAHVADCHERLNMSLSGCNSVTKKRKGKGDMTYKDGPDGLDYLDSSHQQQVNEPTSLKKKGKKKMEAETGSLAMLTSEPLVSERGTADVEPETKRLKKPFTLITPTVHSGFSFSVIHLLSAVRMAMITPYGEDVSEVGKHLQKSDGRRRPTKEEQNIKHEGINGVHENMNIDDSEYAELKSLPSLTVQEIVNRVRSNPGDPCILEMQEPLQDLVRGVLKIFSSKTAPLGAKAWKALVFYEKPTKSWSWIGPVLSSSSDHEKVEEETSSEAWNLPHKMLVKLVDSFANWLKSGQETLQQIGSLPAPPVTFMQPNLDEKERFRDLRAQKSLTTISPSSEEVRAYFRREEVLRYSVPDRAFSYIAADGRKSIVAPLRRCGGKPSSKARDHFMLRPDRPPHVTILCLVRDAAARLPGSIGTRADVCILIRDSQYIVEDVSDAQINQVVSGALDRLHYERDPCVQFDGDRKLWVYLHREREEEDFEDDGTSSTKKWKRQRKDATEHSDQGTVNVAHHGTGEQILGGSTAGYDLSPDLNIEPSSMHEGKRTELAYSDSMQNVEEKVEPSHGSEQGSMHQGHPMGWDVLGLNPMRENKLPFQENSTNEVFDDEAFSRGRQVGLLSASLL